jgi:hypothetical protein
VRTLRACAPLGRWRRPPDRGKRASRPPFTPAHDAVLAVLDWMPGDTAADAALVVALLAMPEGMPPAPRRAGGGRCIASAIIEGLWRQYPHSRGSQARAIVAATRLLERQTRTGLERAGRAEGRPLSTTFRGSSSRFCWPSARRWWRCSSRNTKCSRSRSAGCGWSALRSSPPRSASLPSGNASSSFDSAGSGR